MIIPNRKMRLINGLFFIKYFTVSYNNNNNNNNNNNIINYY